MAVLMIGECKVEPRDCSKLVRGKIKSYDESFTNENYLEVRYEDGTVQRIDGPFSPWPRRFAPGAVG